MTLETPQPSDIPKAYDPKQVEGKWYRFWMERGFFTPPIDPQRKPFVIIMPPPNVTGGLHLGQALTAVLEDIMTRWHRMRGDPTLWLPGVDHAGIAGQNVVEQLLATEGLTRHDLGRERFLERMWEWMNKYRAVISEQHKRLGASCDWTRERFTMEPGPSRAVRTTFVNLFKDGLIYRGERIINWCPRCVTALSDLEVEHKETLGHLYYVRYRLAEGDDFITVATTRPETILGDTAVAVNPEDARFQGLVGAKVILPVVERVIPIVSDEAVDPSFGTGAVKVTPAHDPVDFEVAQRQGLPMVNILNSDGTMNENAGPYAGLDRFACRKRLLSDLEKEGLLVKTESHGHSVGHCQRCGTVIEPWASKQWFVTTKPLAKPAIEAVKEGRIVILPQRFTKVYLNWMENIRDWCISRQLWWGHRIPAWYCCDCDGQNIELAVRGKLEDWERPPFGPTGTTHKRPPVYYDTYSGHRQSNRSHSYIMENSELVRIDLAARQIVNVEDPKSCPYCGGSNLIQDPDVLDTWFSSALWPHSTLGWPESTRDLDYFYPTTVMETGYDILFFWVARMIMMGLYNLGEVPFTTVYLHGLIRDEKGEKMSKSRGNVVDPLEAMERYGTDALRFALSTGSSPGNDMRLSVQKLEGSRNFANKLWNAARFVLSNLGGGKILTAQENSLSGEDRWILSRLNRLVAGVDKLFQDFQFGEAERQIHDFLWGEFCDWYVEMSKIRLRNREEGPSPLPVLTHVLETSLRLLHPFMPFITEEIWQGLRQRLPAEDAPSSITLAPYPIADEAAIDPEIEREMESVIEIVRAIRNARAEAKVEPSKSIEALVLAGEGKSAIESHASSIAILARARPLTILGAGEEGSIPEKAVTLVLKETKVVLPLAGLVDLDRERKRLEREAETSRDKVARLENKLRDQAFLAKAPPNIVEREREKLSEWRKRLERLREELEAPGTGD